MGKPIVTTLCDKCGKVDERPLKSCHKYAEQGIVYANWLPGGWSFYNTEEPDKTFLLCDECEKKFQLSIIEFKP